MRNGFEGHLSVDDTHSVAERLYGCVRKVKKAVRGRLEDKWEHAALNCRFHNVLFFPHDCISITDACWLFASRTS